MTTQIAVRLPDELLEQIDALVPSAHASRSEVIRRAIELYLYRLAAEHDAALYGRLPLTDAEIAFANDPESWVGSPAW
jgi:metal-responsive CopG/Arc/MetJ family transcriptional regulator